MLNKDNRPMFGVGSFFLAKKRKTVWFKNEELKYFIDSSKINNLLIIEALFVDGKEKNSQGFFTGEYRCLASLTSGIQEIVIAAERNIREAFILSGQKRTEPKPKVWKSVRSGACVIENRADYWLSRSRYPFFVTRKKPRYKDKHEPLQRSLKEMFLNE